MGIIRYTAEELKRKKNQKERSDTVRLDALTEEQINEAARNDPDSALPTEEELKQFKPTKHKGGGVYGYEKD